MYIASDPKTIPILRLPFLSIRNILQNFDYLEIIDFSLASKKCQFVIQSMKFQTFGVCVRLQPETESVPITFYRDGDWICKFSIDYLNARYKYLKRNTALTQYKTEINTICIEFTKEWADYTLALFRKDLSCLVLIPNSSTQEILSITDWINKKQSTLEYCEFSGDDTNPDSLDLFFENRKFSIGNLSFVLRPEHKIRPLKLGVLHVDEFFVKNRSSKHPVNWLTVDDIMNSLCRIIMIETCSFDENDINRILKGWLNGNKSQLKSFTVVLKMLNFELVLDGIDFERKDETLKREFEFEFAGRQCNTHQFTGGFDIRRKDGTLATIQQRYRIPSRDPMFWFMMVVWPNNSK